MLLKRFNVEKEATDEAEIRMLISEGYSPLYTVEKDDEEEEAIDLSEFTVKELRNLAKARGISGAGSLKKAELLEILEA